jgi:hypothetical protein
VKLELKESWSRGATYMIYNMYAINGKEEGIYSIVKG